MTTHDAQKESRSTPGTRTSGWQPSRRDYSRATYSASATGYPKAPGQPKTPAGRRYGRIAMTLAAVVGIVALGVFFSGAFEGSRAVAPPTLAPEPVAVLELTHGSVYTVAGGSGMKSPGLAGPALAVGRELEAGAVVETPDARAALRLAGGPLADFLDWVVREGGWELRFADEETAALASTTILHGDIAGLAPIEATAMVFESSGLEYELRDETFVVARKKAV